MKKVLCLIGLTAAFGVPCPAIAAEAPSTDGDLVTLQITEKNNPGYPQRMLAEGVRRGEARIVICVDKDGKLSDSLVVAYTDRAFADVSLNALKTWHFAPPQLHGKPVGAIAEMNFLFEVNGVIVREAPAIPAISTTPVVMGNPYVYEPCNPSELDTTLRPTRVVSPGYPKELSDKNVSGRVVVHFYVDENGKPRFAAATYAADDTLAGTAVAALQQWEFTPPTSKGRPVVVRASQEFVFDPAK